MPALPRVPTVQLWHSEVPTLAKVILPDAVQRMDDGQLGSNPHARSRYQTGFLFSAKFKSAGGGPH
jgi:hypothetical protein